MARSRSPVKHTRERDRRRERSRSPKPYSREKRDRRTPSRDRKRSRSPKRDQKRARRSHSPRDAHRAEKRHDRREDGELVQNGYSKDERSRSLDRSRKRSRSRERRTSLSKERKPGSGGDSKKTASTGKGKPLSEVGQERNGAVKYSESIETLVSENKAEPVSLEELMRKKKAEEEELAKPKFLSKKQREELALQKLKEKAEAKKQKPVESRSGHDPYKSGHDPYRSVADRQREERKQEAEKKLEEDRHKIIEDRAREKELELIKKQYLGTEKVKKKIRKPSEKFHLNFDWEVTDDTSKDLNPIYNTTHEAALLFGSGKRAGVDVQEQRRVAAEHQKQLRKKMRESQKIRAKTQSLGTVQGLTETELDRERDRERQRLAEAFDSLDTRAAVQEHWSSKPRADMTERDWRIFREDFNISYKGVSVTGDALPIRNWKEANLPETLMKAVNELGYKAPSPIQMASIPLGMMQRDVIGVAETGSGKTAAFVLPMICYLMKQPEMTEEIAAEGPYSVVMAPVRELAQQIEEETNKLAKFTPYRTVSVVGGQDINDQAFKLRKGCEIVIATPGRLKDCVEQSFAVLNQCNYVVLDEADRMIDMGFEPQVVGVLEAMPSSNLKPEEEDGILEEDKVYRTTYMFSATMPPPVERLARKYMRRPAVINIGSAGKATDNVTQKVYMVKENEKLGRMDQELEAVSERRVIVFVNTKKACDIVSRHLEHLEHHCTVLHGGKTQDQREASLAGFREEKYNVLVATDVAGRGIDVPNVALVINYDMPTQIEQYTHRIGRTARAGRKGTAITYLTLADTEVFFDLKKLLEDSNAPVPPELARHEASRTKPGSIPDKPRRDMIQYAKK